MQQSSVLSRYMRGIDRFDRARVVRLFLEHTSIRRIRRRKSAQFRPSSTMSAPRIRQQHYAAKTSLRRPTPRKIPCALAALTRDIPYVMTRLEQATYDRAREQ